MSRKPLLPFLSRAYLFFKLSNMGLLNIPEVKILCSFDLC